MTTPIEEKWNIQTLLAKLDDAICSRQNAATPMDRVNAIKNVDTLKSFIENLLEQERKRLAKRIIKDDVTCPEAYGFEGRDTFSACEKCVVCELRSIINK